MRPYRIAAGEHCQKMWIDLDHILAIHDPLMTPIADSYMWENYPPSISMVMAFRDDMLTYKSVPSYKSAPTADVLAERQQILIDMREAHLALLVAWTSK